MPNYIVYKRLSKEDLTGAYLGLDAQQTAIDKFIESNPGSVIIDTFQEIVTGTNKKTRPEFLAAIERCKLTNATLLCSRLDRMSRNLHVITSLMESKINFLALDAANFNTLTIHVIAAVGQEEARVISARVKSALAEAKKRGTILGEKGKLNLNDEARAKGRIAGTLKSREKADEYAKRLEPVLKDCKNRGMSLSDTAKHLSRLQIKTSNGGVNWYPTTVSNLLSRLEAQDEV